MPVLTNWNHQVTFDVVNDNYKTPTTIAEVQAIVKHAGEHGLPVTAVGALHSTTQCTVGKGVVISLERMDRILAVDKTSLTVTAEGGASLHQLCEHLKPLGLQPPVILEFGNFRLGAISGTHANDTSVTRGAQFSSFVVGAKIVTADGGLLTVSEKTNAELLPAVRSHFGLLGVVCEVTVQVFPSQPLQVTFRIGELAPFLDGFAQELPALKAAYDQVFGLMFPHSGRLVWQCRKFVAQPAPDSIGGLIARDGAHLFKGVLLRAVKECTALVHSPEALELLCGTMVEAPLTLLGKTTYHIDPCDRAITYEKSDPGFEFYDWMFPEARWPAMVRDFLALAARFRAQHAFVLPLPALVYMVRRDEASLLSRARGADMMAVDPLYPDPGSPAWRDFRLAFNEVAVRHGGVPHINKTRDGAISHFAKAAEQGGLREYLAVRKRLDPKDMFLNDFFKTMFKEYL